MEVLPAKKDRVDNTFYLLNNEIRFWNGQKLLCEHKKQVCEICRPEQYKTYQEKQRQWREENADRLREWREENADRVKEKQREWREENADRIRDRIRQYYQENRDRIREQHRQWNQENADRIRQYNEENRERRQQYYQENAERIREQTRQYRLTSENARCNDGCIDILHSNDFISFKHKNKYDCPGIRVCYSCAVDDIRLTDDTALKLKKKEYYNIYTTKVNYLHRIEYAILNYLNEDAFIDELNNSFLNIHDKDIVAILGKSTEMERRPDRAYIINNHLIFFEIDERFFDHEKSIERLKHIRSRLESKFENHQSFNLHVVRLNVNADNEETAEKNMVIRKEFPLRENTEQKDVGYVLSDHGIDVIENDFIPLVQKIQQDCVDLKDIENDEKLMIYELNTFDLDHMLDWYVEQNENERNLEYVNFI